MQKKWNVVMLLNKIEYHICKKRKGNVFSCGFTNVSTITKDYVAVQTIQETRNYSIIAVKKGPNNETF